MLSCLLVLQPRTLLYGKYLWHVFGLVGKVQGQPSRKMSQYDVLTFILMLLKEFLGHAMYVIVGLSISA